MRLLQCLACLYDHMFDPKSKTHFWGEELRRLKAVGAIDDDFRITPKGIEILKKNKYPTLQELSARFGD